MLANIRSKQITDMMKAMDTLADAFHYVLGSEYGLKVHFQLPYNSIVDVPQIVIWYI